MPFSRWNYLANKYEADARNHMGLARMYRERGYPELVKQQVQMARSVWRMARYTRAMNDFRL